MIFRNSGNNLVCEQLAGVPSAPKRRIAVYYDAKFLNIGHNFLFLIVGMNLILHHDRRDIDLRQKFL